MTTFTPGKLKKFLLCALLLVTTLATKAQTPYNVNPIPYSPYPYMGNVFNAGDDQYSAVLPIGFTFNFFGLDYTDLVVSANGYVSFNTNLAGSYSAWPISSSITSPGFIHDNAIMGAYQDLFTMGGGTIYYDTYGTAPNRAFVVSFYNAQMYSCNTVTFTGQIVLRETSNIIDIFIANKDFCGWNGGYAIEGIVNAQNTEAYVVPGRDYPTVWTASNDGWRFEYCSATYTDTVKGRVYVDLNHNCVFDGNDYGLQGQVVTSNNACAAAYTDANGFYTLLTEVGTSNVTHTLAPGLLPACPPNNINIVNFPAPNMIQNNVDFADTAINDCSDVNLSIATWNVRPCSTSIYTFAYNNPTPIPTGPMTLTVTMPDSFYYLSSSIPPSSVVGNVYTFPIPAMGPYSSGSMTISDSVDCNVTVGTDKIMAGYIDNPGDCDTSDNDDIEIQEVVNSFDPNNVIVASDHLNFVFGEQITNVDTLTYHINFQNTGTADAIHVTIKDTLDASLDPTSIETIISSHNYQFFNDNGRLTFSFMNINLPDSNSNEPASHGFVRFRVRQMPGNGMGTLIPNQAHIYFDNNSPVLTNIATDTIATLSVANIIANADMKLYPNPANDNVTLEYSKGTGKETVTVYDQLGRVIYTAPMDKKHVITTSSWVAGIYLVRINDKGRGVAGRLLVVE